MHELTTLVELGHDVLKHQESWNQFCNRNIKIPIR